MPQLNQPKLQDLKNQAYALAKQIGLRCKQTGHFKSRGLTKGLDMRCKSSWIHLINRLTEILNRGVVPTLLAA